METAKRIKKTRKCSNKATREKPVSISGGYLNPVFWFSPIVRAPLYSSAARRLALPRCAGRPANRGSKRQRAHNWTPERLPTRFQPCVCSSFCCFFHTERQQIKQKHSHSSLSLAPCGSLSSSFIAFFS